jgi:glycosyltransferase involved in cell wall biosynthesis
VVSIVIVAREYDLKLARCMKSISEQTYQDIQILLEMKGSIVEARQRGIAKAQGEYICLVDSDQILPPQLLMHCVSLAATGFDGVTWTERGLSPSTFCEKVIDYDKMLFHKAHDDDPLFGAAEPRFFKAQLLKRLDFSRLPPITFELSCINKQVRNMGARIVFSELVVYHHEPKTFRELFKKFFRYGFYYIPSLKYNKELVFRHSLPRRVYFRFTSFSNPVLYVGLWYHYLVKGVASTMGAIWYLLSLVGRGRTQAI